MNHFSTLPDLVQPPVRLTTDYHNAWLSVNPHKEYLELLETLLDRLRRLLAPHP